jgi:hypothetical protein
MEVLHRLRGIGLAASLLLIVAAAACKAPPELRPEQLLQDSLGLTERDRVHALALRTDSGVEVADRDVLVIREGDHVVFRTDDRRARAVRFERDSLGPGPTRWAEGAGLFAAPLLARTEMRWVVNFENAPPGRYPYVVLGGAAEGRGVVEVEAR